MGSGIVSALRMVFSEPAYAFLFVVSVLVFGFVYVLVPLVTTPGNTVQTYLSDSTAYSLLLVLVLSLSIGALVPMQVYAWRRTGHRTFKESAGGIAAAGSSVVSGLFTTASCGVCLSALFSFIGAGGVLFLMGHQAEIVALSLILTLACMHFTAAKINGECAACRAPVRGAKAIRRP